MTVTWWVEYADGRRLSEAKLLTFAGVDAEGCVAIELWRAGWTGPKCLLRVAVDLAKGQRAVFARRQCQVFELTGGRQWHEDRAVIAGWRDADGRGSYCFLLPDGRLLFSSDFQAV